MTLTKVMASANLGMAVFFSLFAVIQPRGDLAVFSAVIAGINATGFSLQVLVIWGKR